MFSLNFLFRFFILSSHGLSSSIDHSASSGMQFLKPHASFKKPLYFISSFLRFDFVCIANVVVMPQSIMGNIHALMILIFMCGFIFVFLWKIGLSVEPIWSAIFIVLMTCSLRLSLLPIVIPRYFSLFFIGISWLFMLMVLRKRFLRM